ncbi:MAG: ATP-binding cassette domain-containing protein [Frankia sp.]
MSPEESGGPPAAGEADRDAAVSLRGLRKRYGNLDAVAGIDLDVQPGETFGFLGPNGAGKSTTIKILCTIVQPTGGTAIVAGHDVQRERDAVRRSIGLVFQETTLDDYLTAAQNLRFHADLYGVPKRDALTRAQGLLEMVGLADRRDSKVGTFSGGMKRRLEIARGLLHSPRVLFLDEPTVGLDPVSRATVWRYVDELRRAEGITVFLTTHYLDEAERCDRIAIIAQGRIVALDTPDALKAAVGADRVRLTATDPAAALAALRTRFEVEATTGADGSLTFHVVDGERFLPRLLMELGVPITSVSVTRPTLDDVFFARTGSTISDADAGGPTVPAWVRGRR